MASGDGHHISYWLGTAPGREHPPYTPDGRVVDVAVVGAGITGVMTALLVAEAGASVVVLDAGRVAAGVTGHTTAKVTSLHGLTYAALEQTFGPSGARTYAEANQAGLAEIARLVESLDIDCDFERLPAFTYTEEADRVPTIAAEVEAAVRAGLPAGFTTDVDLPYPVHGAIRVEDQAQFHPRRYCLALADALAARGAAVYENTRVLGVEPGSPCRLVTEHGELRSDQVVVATQLPIFDRGAFFARTYPERSYALAATLSGPVPAGMYLSADTPTRSVRPVTAGGREVVLGGEGHKVAHDPDTRLRYEALERWSHERFKVEEITYRWSAQDYMPADGVPYIGPAGPGASRIFVATGFKKWGMSTAAVAALILRDRIGGRDNGWAKFFDSTRLDPKGEVRKVVTENLDVAKRFVGDRLRARTAPPASGLAAGEAGLCELDGQRVAAFRDEAGRLHAVSPRCTHLGCLVDWNTAERSWDCPCHGSRFTPDGSVLQGPAVRPLEPAAGVTVDGSGAAG
ncbi:MAG: FAD-dependent oxidoreductase [Actinomycetota bacterium]|jgi:glycine/D-amino acid oxidase-like deaminating enzyme/nitrite reductase/ring-hydroxylating ferredoxin subunit